MHIDLWDHLQCFCRLIHSCAAEFLQSVVLQKRQCALYLTRDMFAKQELELRVSSNAILLQTRSHYSITWFLTVSCRCDCQQPPRKSIIARQHCIALPGFRQSLGINSGLKSVYNLLQTTPSRSFAFCSVGGYCTQAECDVARDKV
jgi:hypothetical protein